MKTSPTLKILAGIAVLFGVLTIFSGGQTLFGNELARANAGDVVAFVLLFNFCAGFVYVLTGFGLWIGWHWSGLAASVLAITTALTASALVVYISFGGGYEMRTVVAMALRLGFWIMVEKRARQEFRTLTT